MAFDDWLAYSADNLTSSKPKRITRQGVHTLVKVKVIPDGALRGTQSNVQKLRDLHANPQVIAEALKPTRPPIGMNLKKRTMSAEIEQLQKDVYGSPAKAVH